MNIINYRYDISDKPVATGQANGLTGKMEGPVEGDFLGIIRHNGEDYLVARTTKALGDDSCIGKITVRRATVEIYPDNTGSIFLDINENEITKEMEEGLSASFVDEKSLYEKINHRYDVVINDMLRRENELNATAIKTSAFEKKKMVNDSLDGHLDKVGGKAY
jgi:hypothetical protein